MNSNRQLFGNLLPASGTELTCVPGIDLDYISSSFHRFVRKHFNEHPPATVSYAFRQMPVFDHALYVKFFDIDSTEGVDIEISRLVQEVLALVGYFLVCFSHQDFCLSPSVGTSLPSGQGPLSSSQDSFGLSEELRIADTVAERIDEEGFNANIETDFSIRLRQYMNRDVITREADEPIAGRCTADRDCFDITFNWTGQKEFEPAYAGDIEVSTDDLPSCLLQGEGIVPISSSKSWESCLTFFAFNPAKESIKSSLQSLYYILKYLRAYNFKLREFFLKFRQLILLGNAGDRFFILPVGVDSLIEGKVKEYAACFKPLQAIGFSLLIYFGSVLKCFSHFLLCASMYFLIVSLLTLPAVLTKYDVVHMEGSRINSGNSFLSTLAVNPFNLKVIWYGAKTGKQLTNRCTWSGWISRARILILSSLAFSWRRTFSLLAIDPFNTGLLRLGIQTKW